MGANQEAHSANTAEMRELAAGDRVRTITGYTGTIYQKAKRAAGDIRIARVEAERDLTPYTVAMDHGGFTVYRGHELDLVA